MIPDKRFIEISAMAIIVIVSLGFVSFFIGEQTEQLITGRATTTTRAYVQESPPDYCSVQLKQGWNFVSFYCEAGLTPINETLVDASNNTLDYGAVFTYQSNNPNNKWLINNPDLPYWVENDLTNIDRQKGYWIYMDSAGFYNRSGYQFSSTNVGLNDGWNLIGYPSKNSRNISVGFSSISGNYSRVESYQTINSTLGWYVYVPGSGGNLSTLDSMHAYWINATEDITWVVNW